MSEDDQSVGMMVLAAQIESRGDAILYLIGVPIVVAIMLTIGVLNYRAKHPEDAGKPLIRRLTKEERSAAWQKQVAGARRPTLRTGLNVWSVLVFAIVVLVSLLRRLNHGKDWYVIVLAILVLVVAVLVIYRLVRRSRSPSDKHK